MQCREVEHAGAGLVASDSPMCFFSFLHFVFNLSPSINIQCFYLNLFLSLLGQPPACKPPGLLRFTGVVHQFARGAGHCGAGLWRVSPGVGHGPPRRIGARERGVPPEPADSGGRPPVAGARAGPERGQEACPRENGTLH